MREMVNKFLDDYCREDIVCVESSSLDNENSHKIYHIMSGDITIVFFTLNDIMETRVALYRSTKICNVVKSMFTITYGESAQYIKKWVSDKLSLKDVDDLINLIP